MKRRSFSILGCVLLLGGCVAITHIHVADQDDIRTHIGWPGTRIVISGDSTGAVVRHKALGPSLLVWDGGFATSLLASNTRLATAPRQRCAAIITGQISQSDLPIAGVCVLNLKPKDP